jgi:hypothetical protein
MSAAPRTDVSAASSQGRHRPSRNRPNKERSTLSTDPEMKHTTSRMLFAYWDALRGERAAPDRDEIEPTRLRHVLADTFILAAETDGEPRFRLAGTRCTALFGRDLKCVTLRELWGSGDDGSAAEFLHIVSRETSGLVASLRGRTDEGTGLDLELLLLPLRHGGRTDGRIIGAVSPSAVPSWMGLVPVTSLQTRSLRVIRSSEGDVAARGFVAPTRPRFTVLEGGRAH